MDEAMLWAISLILGVPSALLILLNWLALIGCAAEARRQGTSRAFSFCPPFLCGFAGSVACLACPWPGVWCWAWVPPLLDPSIGLLLLASVLHVIARVGGLRSPLDGEPARPLPGRKPAEPGSRAGKQPKRAVSRHRGRA